MRLNPSPHPFTRVTQQGFVLIATLLATLSLFAILGLTYAQVTHGISANEQNEEHLQTAITELLTAAPTVIPPPR